MKAIIVFLTVFFWATNVWSESVIPAETKVDHAWVQGVYWNPSVLPSWGFFADVQEETFFGAIYGYDSGEPTFIILVGSRTRMDPLEFRGDVLYVTNGGASETDVGNFTWRVGYYNAMPAARLDISSNILNYSNLLLTRFSYMEIDEIDIISGADWNIVEEILIMFADNYSITDDRLVEDGITYVLVVNNYDDDDIGVAAYYPPEQGEMFGMLVPMDEDTNNFYVFYADDTNMYGRYWLLDADESPTGSGYYFHGSTASMQEANDHAGVSSTPAHPSIQSSDAKVDLPGIMADENAIKQKKLEYMRIAEELDPMFSDEQVAEIFESVSRGLTALQGKADTSVE